MKIINFNFVLLTCVLGDTFALCSGHNVLNSVCYVKEPAFIPRVIGGTPAALGEMPYQVGFKKLKRKRHFYYTFCGGVIIREDKLLSAAHCFVTGNTSISASKVLTVPPRNLEAIYAVAGTLFNHEILKRDSEGTEQWRELKLVVYPGTYKFPLKSDIAVVITLSPFLFNTYVNKIGYAKHFKDYIGSCLASGYGRLSKRNKVQSEILLKARLELLPHFWCSRKLSRNMKDLVCTAITTTDIAKVTATLKLPQT